MKTHNPIRWMMLPMILALLWGCSEKKSFRIEGKLENFKKKHIYVSHIEIDTPVLTDSVRVKRDGSFSLRVGATEPGFYQLGAGANDFITILAEPGERIKVNSTGSYLSEGFEVSGSPGTSKIVRLDSALSETKRRIDSLSVVLEREQDKPDFETTSKAIDDRFLKILKDQRMYNISFILKNLGSFASIKALYQKVDDNTYVLYDYRDLQYLKLVSDTLFRYYPNSMQVKALKANFEKELNAFNMNKIDQMTKDAPVINLDPSLKDVNGRLVSLSDLRGKYVLLAFWSAASRDCLAENLEFKNLYNKYKSSGLEIYQINLDLNEDTWKNAVRYDELPWISVREDDPMNPKNAILYNVRTLPANFMYDKTGNIIATNLHGRTLQIKLTQLFGK